MTCASSCGPFACIFCFFLEIFCISLFFWAPKQPKMGQKMPVSQVGREVEYNQHRAFRKLDFWSPDNSFWFPSFENRRGNRFFDLKMAKMAGSEACSSDSGHKLAISRAGRKLWGSKIRSIRASVKVTGRFVCFFPILEIFGMSAIFGP